MYNAMPYSVLEKVVQLCLKTRNSKNRHLIHHWKGQLVTLREKTVHMLLMCLIFHLFLFIVKIVSVIFPPSFDIGTWNNKSNIYNTQMIVQCRSTQWKKKGCFPFLSKFVVTVTCSNSKEVQMKVKIFKPTIFLLMRKQNIPAPICCSSLPSSPYLIKEDPKEGSCLRSQFRNPVSIPYCGKNFGPQSHVPTNSI